MNTNYSIEKEKKKIREIKKRNALSLLIFLLLVLACAIISHFLPEKAEHQEHIPQQDTVIIVKLRQRPFT